MVGPIKESYWEWAHSHSISTQNPNQFLLVCSWEWPRGNLLGNNISLVWIMICGFRQRTFSFFTHRQQFPHCQRVLSTLINGIIVAFFKAGSGVFFCVQCCSMLLVLQKSISWNDSNWAAEKESIRTFFVALRSKYLLIQSLKISI